MAGGSTARTWGRAARWPLRRSTAVVMESGWMDWCSHVVVAPSAVGTTNAIEQHNREFRRRPTRTLLPCAEAVPMPFQAFLVATQSRMGKMDDRTHLCQPFHGPDMGTGGAVAFEPEHGGGDGVRVDGLVQLQGAPSAVGTTNAIEQHNRERRRRITTRTILPCAETVPMPFRTLLVATQSRMGKVDGWTHLCQPFYGPEMGTGGAVAFAPEHGGGDGVRVDGLVQLQGAPSAVGTTNAIEQHNRERRRRPTRTLLPCAEAVPMPFRTLLVATQSRMGKVDGWTHLCQPFHGPDMGAGGAVAFAPEHGSGDGIRVDGLVQPCGCGPQCSGHHQRHRAAQQGVPPPPNPDPPPLRRGRAHALPDIAGSHAEPDGQGGWLDTPLPSHPTLHPWQRANMVRRPLPMTIIIPNCSGWSATPLESHSTAIMVRHG